MLIFAAKYLLAHQKDRLTLLKPWKTAVPDGGRKFIADSDKKMHLRQLGDKNLILFLIVHLSCNQMLHHKKYW